MTGYGFASFVNFCLRKPSWSLRSSVKRTNPGSAGRLEVWRVVWSLALPGEAQYPVSRIGLSLTGIDR